MVSFLGCDCALTGGVARPTCHAAPRAVGNKLVSRLDRSSRGTGYQVTARESESQQKGMITSVAIACNEL